MPLHCTKWKENNEINWFLIYRIFFTSSWKKKYQWNCYHQQSMWIIYSDMVSVRRITFPIHIDLDDVSLVLIEVARHREAAGNITLAGAASHRLSLARMWLNRNRKQHRWTPDVCTAWFSVGTTPLPLSTLQTLCSWFSIIERVSRSGRVFPFSSAFGFVYSFTLSIVCVQIFVRMK